MTAASVAARRSVRALVAVVVVGLVLGPATTAHASAPANDLTPTLISSLPFTDSISTVDASAEGYFMCFTPSHSVYYSWTAPATSSGTISVSADTFGSDYNTAMTVYNDDGDFCNDDAGGGSQSQVRWTALPGRTYTIAVSSIDDTGGNLVFNLAPIQVPPPPPNDTRATATAIPDVPFEQTLATGGAASELGTPPCGSR